MKMSHGLAVGLFGLFSLGFAVAVFAAEYNFHEQADKKGCASIITERAARSGTSKAQGCVTARENVQKWFMETGIRLTEPTRDDALRLRKDLLDKLAGAQRKQADAKSKRDAKPGDSSAQSDYDRATGEMRKRREGTRAVQ